MIIFLTLDDGYVNGWGSTRSTDNDVELDLDDDHEFFESDCHCWKYENGELVFDEEKQKQLIEEYEKKQNKPSEIDMLALAVMELGKLLMNGGE